MFQVVETGLARTPNVPLNGTVRAGALLFSSHIPKDPATAAIVQGDIAVQTRRMLANLEQSVEAAGGTLRDVTQVVVYLVDAKDFAGFNAVYREVFSDPYPSRSTVVVKELLAPGMLIECLAYAVLGDPG